MDKRTKPITTFLLLLLPTLVFANAGSPMMWFGILHSLILNAFIGWTESVIIDKFKIPNRTWLIIIGNYVSMFIGLYDNNLLLDCKRWRTLVINTDEWKQQRTEHQPITRYCQKRG